MLVFAVAFSLSANALSLASNVFSLSPKAVSRASNSLFREQVARQRPNPVLAGANHREAGQRRKKKYFFHVSSIESMDGQFIARKAFACVMNAFPIRLGAFNTQGSVSLQL